MGLPIRQRLKALTCLKPGPKAVLMEVCELHENGGRGCFASNDALAKKLGVSLATVTRTVGSLITWGLLTGRVVPAEANRRYLAPTAPVRACYTGGTEAEQVAAAAKLTIVKTDAPAEMTIVKPAPDYSQTREVTIVKNEADYSQNASRVIGDKQEEQNTSKDNQLVREALVLAEKKIEALESQLLETKGNLDLSRKTITDLRAELQASQTRGRAANVAAATVQLPFSGEVFAAKWHEYREWLGIASNSPREREMLTVLTKMAGGEKSATDIVAQSLRKGWKDLYPLDAAPAQQNTANANPQRHAVYPRNNAANGPAARAQFVPDVTDYGTL